jgi:hypothetical protein
MIKDHVRAATKILNEKGVNSRKLDMKRKRGERKISLILKSDHFWFIDNYDKLRNYGIKIYVEINAYSRRIIWSYYGNSNRIQASVTRQYLEAVAKREIRSRFLRFDKGSETPLVADAQYSFYKK